MIVTVCYVRGGHPVRGGRQKFISHNQTHTVLSPELGKCNGTNLQLHIMLDPKPYYWIGRHVTTLDNPNPTFFAPNRF